MSALGRSLQHGIAFLAHRKIVIGAMVGLPVLVAVVFMWLLSEGLPVRTPVAVVDLDHTELSRRVGRNLAANQMVQVTEHCNSYHEAVNAVKEGRVFGFFVIPHQFAKDAIGGDKPALSFYCNDTYFVPGTLVFKGFKTISVTTSGGLVQAQLVQSGAESLLAGSGGAMLSPVKLDVRQPGNPWMNYSYYLTTTFVPCALCLMILLVTVYSITGEIKHGTSVQWLKISGGSMVTALLGKLLPQTVIFSLVGWAIQGVMYGFLGFPLNCSPWIMILAMFLTVTATQCLGVVIAELLPNPRLGLSIAALLGILVFSIGGFSFPVENMYGGVGIFSYLMPIRYYFLIHATEAINGAPFYFVRVYFGVLALFPLAVFPLIGRLRRACLKPVYVP